MFRELKILKKSPKGPQEFRLEPSFQQPSLSDCSLKTTDFMDSYPRVEQKYWGMKIRNPKISSRESSIFLHGKITPVITHHQTNWLKPSMSQPRRPHTVTPNLW